MINIDRLLYRPLALLPAHGAALVQRILLLQPNTPEAIGPFDVADNLRPYEVIDGVAVVPISGVLVHEYCWWYGETTYASLRRTLMAAVVDTEVRAVVLYVNSPGGEVAGCFDLADAIFEMRGSKPIWAILDESAYSAAYALASAADRVIVPRTGGTGSIGVITLRLDITTALEQMGVKITTIQFGDRKTDSYPTTPLSDEARNRLQTDIDVMGEMFVAMVARNRGVNPDAVRATQAGTFLGSAGVAAGLADAVMAPDEAFLSLVQTLET